MSTTASTSTLLNPIWRLLGWLSILMAIFTTNVFAGQVSLAWNASTGPVAGYRVYYGTSSGSYASNMNAGNTTTATVASLADGATYYFAVKAYDSAGNESGFSNEVNKTMTVAAPVASFSADKTSGTAPVTVNLADTSTGTITSRAWDLGDGTTSTAQSVAKTYSAAGTYTVKLTVTNAGGSTTASKTISVTTSTVAAPVASFSATPTSGTAPLLVTLTDTSTGTVSARTWDLGDGTTSTAQSVAKTYNAAGTYAVKLTVTNAGGGSTTSKTISATASTPTANFTASPNSGVAPLPVTFSNSSTGTVVSYSWNFGDNTTSTAQNPTKTYSNPGTYTVTLTATGASGTTPSTKTQTITVSAASASTGGLVAAYNFEEASGNTVVDASGNGNHGTITEAARTTSGKFGSALSFDGVNDRVSLGRSLDFSAPFTAEAWIYPTSYARYRVILSKRDSFSPSDMSFDIGLNAGTGAVYVQDGTMRLASYAPPLNAWTHIAVTIDTGKSISLYVNGAFKQSLGTLSPGSDSAAQVLIGSTGDLDDPFQGRIDEVRIYNRALSVTEITNEWNKAVEVTSPPKRLLGDEASQSVTGSTQQGIPIAFKTMASFAGMVTTLPVYLDTSSASTILVAGLYKDNSGRPGTLLAQGTLSSPKAGTLNWVRLPATAVQANTTYWVAILSPSGALKYKAGSVAQPNVTSAKTSSSSLPSSWQTISSSSGGMPAYGAGY